MVIRTLKRNKFRAPKTVLAQGGPVVRSKAAFLHFHLLRFGDFLPLLLCFGFFEGFFLFFFRFEDCGGGL